MTAVKFTMGKIMVVKHFILHIGMQIQTRSLEVN